MAKSAEAQRAPAWGADLPPTEAEARARLLDAAEACFLERGPSKTKVTHVAAKAGVHRTTVYSYFANMDEILAACFVKATNLVVDAAEPYFAQRGPFIERLIMGALAGLGAARSSPTMRAMTTPRNWPARIARPSDPRHGAPRSSTALSSASWPRPVRCVPMYRHRCWRSGWYASASA